MTLEEFYERLRILAQDAVAEEGSQAMQHCAVVLLCLQGALVEADEVMLRQLSTTAGRLSISKQAELATLQGVPS